MLQKNSPYPQYRQIIANMPSAMATHLILNALSASTRSDVTAGEFVGRLLPWRTK